MKNLKAFIKDPAAMSAAFLVLLWAAIMIYGICNYKAPY